MRNWDYLTKCSRDNRCKYCVILFFKQLMLYAWLNLLYERKSNMLCHSAICLKMKKWITIVEQLNKLTMCDFENSKIVTWDIQYHRRLSTMNIYHMANGHFCKYMVIKASLIWTKELITGTFRLTQKGILIFTLLLKPHAIVTHDNQKANVGQPSGEHAWPLGGESTLMISGDHVEV